MQTLQDRLIQQAKQNNWFLNFIYLNIKIEYNFIN